VSTFTSPEKIRELLDVVQTVSQELDLDKLLQLIMERTSRIMNADRSTLFVVDRAAGQLWSKVAQGVDVQEIRFPIGAGIAGTVARTGETVNIPDAYADPRFNQEIDRQTGYRTRTILCMPIRDAAGTITAVLQVLNKHGSPDAAFDAEDEELLRAFASQVAIAIRNAEQMEQIERRRVVSEVLLEVMKSFASELDVDALLTKIMSRMAEAMNADRSTLFLVDRKRNEIWSKVAQGAGLAEIRVPIGQGIAGTVAATGEIINIPDAYADPRFNQAIDRRTGYHTRTILCAPVRDPQGEIIGVSQVLNKAIGVFTREDEELLTALSVQAFMALENARLFEAVLYMKNYNESILRSMATGVMTVDHEGTVNTVNPAFEKIFALKGATPGAVKIADLLDVQHNAPLVAQIQTCIELHQPYEGYEVKYTLPASESSVSMNLSVVPLQDSKKQPLGVVVVADDITQEQRLMSTLCRYVTREIAEEVLKDQKKLRLGGDRQQVSILFSDIRNFTTISEQHAPEEMVAFLNDYFSAMIQEIFAEQGTLDKFIGDAVMAVFGAPIARPNDPVRAVRAAVRMRRALKVFNERQRQAGKWVIQTGIGICHGDALSGNIGSELRMDYTVIGDSVNLAARLEDLTKRHPYKILVNDVIYEQVKDQFECVFVGLENVKGKNTSVKVYGIPEPVD
jgi:adenylate cyclase